MLVQPALADVQHAVTKDGLVLCRYLFGRDSSYGAKVLRTCRCAILW